MGQTIIQELLLQKKAFVLYRIPGELNFTLLIPSEVIQVDLEKFDAQEKGFVVFPFAGKRGLLMKGEEFAFEQELTIDLNQLKTVPVDTKDLENREFKIEEYKDVVKRFISDIRSGIFDKLVLSRSLAVPALGDEDIFPVVDAAAKKYPSAFVYLMQVPMYGRWLGATPELLVEVEGEHIRTIALAGTKSITDERDWTPKEIKEQQLVADYIEACFLDNDMEIESMMGPTDQEAGNLIHLKTNFLAKRSDKRTLGQFIHYLHPTPAVCGIPKENALDEILQTEPHNRYLYTGFLGPVSPDRSSLFVNLRCMNLQKDHSWLFAGGGITAESDPDQEFLETEKKLSTLLPLLPKTDIRHN